MNILHLQNQPRALNLYVAEVFFAGIMQARDKLRIATTRDFVLLATAIYYTPF
jgi:hypothetical protein